MAAPSAAAAKRPPKRAPAKKVTAKSKQRRPKPAPKAQAEKPLDLDQHPLVARLKQYPNGHGVVVFEPVPGTDVPTNVAQFGSGASRWLNLVVGGHGELSKTPLLVSVAENLPAGSKNNPRLTLAAARGLRTSVGLTHAGLGEIQKAGAGYRMVYRVHDLKTGAELGAPVEAAGDLPALTAALPRMAGELAKRLGVETPRVPPIGETAGELEYLGIRPWRPGPGSVDEIDFRATFIRKRLFSDEPRDPAPLTALFYLTRLAANRQYVPKLRDELLQVWPDNTLLLGELAYLWWRTDAEASERLLPLATAATKRFPQSAAAQAAVSYYQCAVGQPDLARPAAEALVRCNTADPNTWLALARVLSEQADSIRNGRFAGDVTAQEMERISKFYEEAVIVSLKAAQPNPHSSPVMANLAVAATFAGIPDLADRALQRSLEVNPKYYQAVAWGLEMYQPKWYDDPAKLEKMAQLAVEASPDWAPYQRIRVAFQLRHSGLVKYVDRVLKTDAERQRYENALHND